MCCRCRVLHDRIQALTAAHDLIHGAGEGTSPHALIRLMAGAYEARSGASCCKAMTWPCA